MSHSPAKSAAHSPVAGSAVTFSDGPFSAWMFTWISSPGSEMPVTRSRSASTAVTTRLRTVMSLVLAPSVATRYWPTSTSNGTPSPKLPHSSVAKL